MVKSVFSDGKGLVQSAGSHVIVENKLYSRNSALDVVYQGAQATTADSTAVVSAANIATGIIQCTPTADRSKATDTAANIISALSLDVDNDAADFSLINLATDGQQNVTLTGGTGVTLVGKMVVHAQDAADDAVSNGVGRFRVRRTGAAAVTIYRIA